MPIGNEVPKIKPETTAENLEQKKPMKAVPEATAINNEGMASVKAKEAGIDIKDAERIQAIGDGLHIDVAGSVAKKMTHAENNLGDVKALTGEKGLSDDVQRNMAMSLDALRRIKEMKGGKLSGSLEGLKSVLDEKLAKDGKPSGEKTELEKKMDMSLDMLEGIKKGKAARKLEEGEGEKTKVCAKCGNENPLGNKFCEDCGNGFEKVEEKNPEKVVPVAKETGNIQEKLKEASIDTAEISIGKDRKVGVSSREYERLRTLLGLGNDDLNKFIENNQKIKDFQAIIDKNKKE